MKALFVILNETEELNAILEDFVKVGVRGATIIDSQGMGAALTMGDVPIFGGLMRMMHDNNRPYNKVIFTVIEDEAVLEAAVGVVDTQLGDLSKPGVGLMFSVPVDNVWGWTNPDYTE